jgi:CubicO group peptidase (beta-lactamase class C family)
MNTKKNIIKPKCFSGQGSRRQFLRTAGLGAFGIAGGFHQSLHSTAAAREVPASIPAVDKLANDALATSGVPGVSVAIAKDGMLVYAKGYGAADATSGEAMTEQHRGRIASISKPITATAIVQLVEQGILAFDDAVFGDNGVLGNTYGTRPYPAEVLAIKIDHLLYHLIPEWGNSIYDATFDHKDLTREELISWVLDNNAPKSAPGNVYDYSNFGFCLLGRVIEAVTGKRYEDVLKSTVLSQCGITGMQIAANTLAERAPDEMVYGDGSTGPDGPYDFPIARMDSHGGWIATSTDLLRFMVRMDAFAIPVDIVSADSLVAMTTPSPVNPEYARGWIINTTPATSWWHIGWLPGSESIVVREDTGMCYAVITNGNGLDCFSLGSSMAYATDWGAGTPL